MNCFSKHVASKPYASQLMTVYVNLKSLCNMTGYNPKFQDENCVVNIYLLKNI